MLQCGNWLRTPMNTGLKVYKNFANKDPLFAKKLYTLCSALTELRGCSLLVRLFSGPVWRFGNPVEFSILLRKEKRKCILAHTNVDTTDSKYEHFRDESVLKNGSHCAINRHTGHFCESPFWKINR